MSPQIYVRNYDLPTVNIKEALRYMGGKEEESTLSLLRECIEECLPLLSYKVCYGYSDIKVNEEEVEFSFGTFRSKLLAKNLKDSREAVLFGATIGLEMDRLISKYGRLAPAKGVCFQGLGSERIEALCDAFNNDIREEEMKKGRSLSPRFSPGYGDLALNHQREIFAFLDCKRKIGLSLNESMLMSPSKSVTAIIGISDCGRLPGSKGDQEDKCRKCGKVDCVFREIKE